MSDDRTLDRAARSWLEFGPTKASDHAIEAALLEIQTTQQERDWQVPWRVPTMSLRNAIAAAAVLAVVGVGAVAIGRIGSTNTAFGTLPSASLAPTLAPAASPTLVATPSPTVAPSGSDAPAASAAASFVPVGALTQTHVSSLYAYKVRYPATWKLTPGTHPGLVNDVEADLSLGRADFYGDTIGNGHGLMVTSAPLSPTAADIAAWSALVDAQVRQEFGGYLHIGACLKSTRTLVLDGEPAKEVDYICPDHDWLWVTAIHAGRDYQVTWLDDGGFSSDSLRPLLDKFLKTFAFTG
jgi:hypothetical protein